MRSLLYAVTFTWMATLAGLSGLAAEPPSADTAFAVSAAGGLAAVQAAQLAEKQAAAPSVKQFAQQMEKDHTAANNELMQIAKGKAVMRPTGPDSTHMATLEQMAKLSGTAFDQQYMQGHVSDHRTTVAPFQQEASSGQDAQLKAFA